MNKQQNLLNNVPLIQETVNKTVEKYQYPAYNKHRSLLGWCSMNYSKVMINPLLRERPERHFTQDNFNKQEIHSQVDKQLTNLYQLKNKHTQFSIKKPFTNLKKYGLPFLKEGQGNPPPDFKASSYTLTTTKLPEKIDIVQTATKYSSDIGMIHPQQCMLGNEDDSLQFNKKVKQIGEIDYKPVVQSEEIRHLKYLPEPIITEQSLMNTLNPRLKKLNLQNHFWVSVELITKIGYLAQNLTDLSLAGLMLNDNVLLEIEKSCKHLDMVDFSNCVNITEKGIKTFLIRKPMLVKFFYENNDISATNDSLSPLNQCELLEHLNVSFCKQLTGNFLESIIESKCSLRSLYVTALKQITADKLTTVIQNSVATLQIAEFAFLSETGFTNSALQALGQCSNLQSLAITGNQSISDMGIGYLGASGNMSNLTILKMGGLKEVAEGGINRLAKSCQNIEFLEMNGIEQMTDENLLTLVGSLKGLKKLFINLVPLVSQAVIDQLTMTHPKLQIIRHLTKFSDPKDDGLRMPLVSIASQLAKKKKKKKKKK